jgi:N-acyl-D-aspartate/D-glutamate deacylase
MFETIIRNGILVDGAGNPWIKADLGIAKGKIARIGRIGKERADESIDAKGLVVAPGFIDIHDHSDYTILAAPNAESKLTQGVTTTVIGNCGSSVAPLLGPALAAHKATLKLLELNVNWSTLSEYGRVLEKKRPAINVASLVGHGTLRTCIMGFDNRSPSEDELTKMKKLLGKTMKEGALGLSSGLEFNPGQNAKTDELIELCKTLIEFNGIYVTHMRNRDTRVFESTKEAIEIGERSGVPVHLSHFVVRFPAEGKSGELLRMVDDARTRGVDATCDVISPSTILGGVDTGYHWGYTGLAAQVIPPWGFEGGLKKTLERLKDPATREKFKKEVEPEWKLVSAGRWDRVKLLNCEKNRELLSKTFEEIAKIKGVDPWEAAYDILLAEGTTDTLRVVITGATTAEKDSIEVVKHPTASICSDRTTASLKGPTSKQGLDPNVFGAFPRFLKRHVREKRSLTLEETIKKMTGLSAQRLRFKDRGLLREGMWADVTVFDLSEITDRATFEKPYEYSAGVEYVFVNGQKALEHGQPTGLRSGKFIKRSP